MFPEIRCFSSLLGIPLTGSRVSPTKFLRLTFAFLENLIPFASVTGNQPRVREEFSYIFAIKKYKNERNLSAGNSFGTTVKFQIASTTRIIAILVFPNIAKIFRFGNILSIFDLLLGNLFLMSSSVAVGGYGVAKRRKKERKEGRKKKKERSGGVI